MTPEQRLGDAVSGLEPQLRQLAADLIAIPSVGGTAAEAEVQWCAAGWLRRLGLDVEAQEVTIDADAPGFPGMEVRRDSLVRVVGRVTGDGRAGDLLLLGHTDVVPAPDAALFSPRWRDGVLHGRGASDMKSGVAAMCIAAAALARCGSRLPGDVVVALVSAEEDGGAGTFDLLRDRATLHLAPRSSALIPEPTAGAIVSANAGCLTFRIRVPGRAAHGALRWLGRNPIDAVPALLQALRSLEAERCRDAGPLFAGWPLAYPISIGTIRAGDWASTVPGELQLTGRYGVRLGETLDEARASFEAAVARAAADEPALADHPPQVTWWGAEFASASTSEEAAIVAALRAAGAPPDLAAAPYGSDLRLVLGMAGLPAVQFGPGRPDDAHTDDESVRWSEVVACARTIALAAARLMALGSPVDNPASSRAAPGTLPSCRRPMI